MVVVSFLVSSSNHRQDLKNHAIIVNLLNGAVSTPVSTTTVYWSRFLLWLSGNNVGGGNMIFKYYLF
jgi:hypothetical protein